MKYVLAFTALGAGLLLAGCKPHAAKYVSPEQVKLRAKIEAAKGLPMRLVLPVAAAAAEDLDLVEPRFDPGMTHWEEPFAYTDGFEKIVETFDQQLKPQGFSRLSGPLHDVDPGFRMSDTIKPVTASGKKAWYSQDRRIVAFLTYHFQRGAKGAEDINSYDLGVLKADNPQAVKPPNRIVPIP